MMSVLIEASVRMALVGCGVGLALALTRVRSAGARHACWASVMLAMLASPLWIAWSPELPVSVPRVPSIGAIVPSPSRGSSAVVPDAPRESGVAPRAASAAGRVSDVNAVPSGRRSSLQGVATLWLAGVLVLLARAVIGWRLARRLALRGTPVDAADLPAPPGVPVVESPHVAAPVVVGVLRPRIVLPAAWRAWSDEHVEAALVHESTHVRRRDTLWALLARLNGCVFWFHPLAWCLERAIARAAEQACDEEVVRRTGRGDAYAALLVTIADAIRARGSRVSWQAVGMAGRGRLEARVDRVLAIGRLQPPSRARLAILAVTCGVAILAGLACQQQPAPLRPNAEYTARLEERDAQTRHLREALEMTPDQFEALEARATSNPDDLEAVEAVLLFYDWRGQDLFGWEGMLARRRPHLLRAIERHPESMAARKALVQRYDPETYESARALWLAHVAPPDVPPMVLFNAAEFFRASDKPRAEELLVRGRALDPDGPRVGPAGIGRLPWSWTFQLGALYGQAIVGADDHTPLNVVRSISVEEASGDYAQSVRRMLEETTDASLLFYAAQYLMSNASVEPETLGFDPRVLGRAYLDRALTLDPELASAQVLRASDDARLRYAAIQDVANAARADASLAFESLTERERFELAAKTAEWLYMGAEGGFADDPARMRASLDAARLFAGGALALSDRFRSDPHYGTVVYDANIVLGQLALRDGERSAAVEYLRSAADSPGSPELELGSMGLGPRLASYLLEEGERESIIAFYERLAEINPAGRDRWLADADAIRAGQMTGTYQAIYGTEGD